LPEGNLLKRRGEKCEICKCSEIGTGIIVRPTEAGLLKRRGEKCEICKVTNFYICDTGYRGSVGKQAFVPDELLAVVHKGVKLDYLQKFLKGEFLHLADLLNKLIFS
jgi:hypothetical protein